ncbi:hypothetical protein [Saccharolobus islandicus]|nr:hypothetical protein [Sulfolobus islandicus]
MVYGVGGQILTALIWEIFSRSIIHSIRRIHRKGIYVKRNEKWRRFVRD